MGSHTALIHSTWQQADVCKIANWPPVTSDPPLAHRNTGAHSLLQMLPGQNRLFELVSTASWVGLPSGCGPVCLMLDPGAEAPRVNK